MRIYRVRANYKRVARLEFNSGICIVPTAPVATPDWPSRNIWKEEQNGHESPRGSVGDSEVLVRITYKVWISHSNDSLKIKLLTIAHAGQPGHRSSEATVATLREAFVWTDIIPNEREFVFNCLLCVLSRSGATVPRPLPQTLQSTEPNDVLHFEHLFLGRIICDIKYALVVKDDFNWYAWDTPTSNATAQHTAETISRCQKTCTDPAYWVSDQRVHFIN